MKRRTPVRRRPPSKRARKRPDSRRSRRSLPRRVGGLEVRAIESVRKELERATTSSRPARWNAEPDDVRRSVAKLVLTLVEFLRQLLERQAIRRMDENTLTPEEVEAIGTALMRLEETVREIGAMFDLSPEDLNLDLGPIGKLV